MRLRQVIEALEKAERENPDLKDWDVGISTHDDLNNSNNQIVDNIRISPRGVQIVRDYGPTIRRG